MKPIVAEETRMIRYNHNSAHFHVHLRPIKKFLRRLRRRGLKHALRNVLS